MSILKFDPLRDRLSRDIRNALSEAVMDTISKLELTPAEAAASRFLTPDLAPVYREYIDNRLHSYAKALDLFRQGKGATRLEQAMVLWDLGLFFEVHEVLEHAWLQSEGREKLVYQALIRAAGVYIHLAQDNPAGARKMAAKAAPVLNENRDLLPPDFNLELLLDKLNRVDPSPPILSMKPPE